MMTKMKIAAGAWVVVCDGGKALILSNAGDDKFPNLRTRASYRRENPPTHEQGTDAPGRAFASVGSARSAVGQTDWHEQAETDFLHRLADEVNEAIAAGATAHLFLVAPPRALGTLRQALAPAARQAVRLELDRDYTNLPPFEIEQRLLDAANSAT
jgi:protein required for attachment to host cells